MVLVQVWDEHYGQLFTGTVIFIAVACWSIAWVLLHPIIKEALVSMENEVAKNNDHVKLKAFIQEKNKNTSTASLASPGPPLNRLDTLESEENSNPKVGRQTAVRVAETFNSRLPEQPQPTNVFKAWVLRRKYHHGHFQQDRLPQHLRGHGRTKEGWAAYTQKLQREFLYYIIASMTGLTLSAITAFQDDPVHDLLTYYSSVRQIIFTGAMAHWLVHVFEDIWCWNFLSTGYNVREAPQWCCSWIKDWNAAVAHFAHNLVMLVTYGLILGTNRYGGLGVQTLVSELPSVLLSRRMLAFAKDIPPMWMCNPKTVKAHWAITAAILMLARVPLFGLWLYSLPPGRGADILEEHLDTSEEQVLSALVGVFLVKNLITMSFLMYMWVLDVARAIAWSDDYEVFEQELRNLQSPGGVAFQEQNSCSVGEYGPRMQSPTIKPVASDSSKFFTKIQSPAPQNVASDSSKFFTKSSDQPRYARTHSSQF